VLLSRRRPSPIYGTAGRPSYAAAANCPAESGPYKIESIDCQWCGFGQNSGGLQVEPAPDSGGLQVEPAPDSGGLQVEPAPEKPATRGGPAAGGRKIRFLPEVGAACLCIYCL